MRLAIIAYVDGSINITDFHQRLSPLSLLFIPTPSLIPQPDLLRTAYYIPQAPFSYEKFPRHLQLIGSSTDI